MTTIASYRSTLINWVGNLLLIAVVIGLGLFSAQGIVAGRWLMVISLFGAVAFLVVILTHPLASLLIWLVVAPFASYYHIAISLGAGVPDLSLNRLASAFMVVVILAQRVIGRRRLVVVGLTDPLMILFLLGLAISVPQSVLYTPVQAAQTLYDWYIVPYLVFFLARNLIRDQRSREWGIRTLFLIAAYLSFLTIVFQVAGVTWFAAEGRTTAYTASLRRVTVLLGNPAFIAMILDMILPFALRQIANAPGRLSRLVGAGFAGFILLGAGLALSRAGWLGAVLVILTMALLDPRLRRYLKPGLVIVALLIAVLWQPLLQSPIITERLLAQGPIEDRFSALTISLEFIRQSPIFGIGYENFVHYYYLYSPRAAGRLILVPHNSYVHTLLSGGLIAFLPFVGFLAAVLWQSWRLYRRMAAVGRASLPDTPVVGADRSLIRCLWAAFLAYTIPSATLDVSVATFVNMIFYFILGLVLGMGQTWNLKLDPCAS